MVLRLMKMINIGQLCCVRVRVVSSWIVGFGYLNECV